MKSALWTVILLYLLPTVTSLLTRPASADFSLAPRSACPRPLSEPYDPLSEDSPKQPDPSAARSRSNRDAADHDARDVLLSPGHEEPEHHDDLDYLHPRAWPRRAQPLSSPSLTGATDAERRKQMVAWMKAQRDKRGGKMISIKPSDRQMALWRIMTSDGTDAPMGVTGSFYEWPKTMPRRYVMTGLQGCTAVFIASEAGFWAAHFWEQSYYDPVKGIGINGAGVFRGWAPQCGAPLTVRTVPVDRTDADFKRLAVDPLHVFNTAFMDSFISLAVLKTRHGDPFGSEKDKNGREARKRASIVVLTPDNSKSGWHGIERGTDEQYKSKIDLLVKQGLMSRRSGSGGLPRAELKRETYTKRFYLDEDDPLRKENVAGTVIVQFTPDEGEGTARVRIWNDDKLSPVLERTWKMDRA